MADGGSSLVGDGTGSMLARWRIFLNLPIESIESCAILSNGLLKVGWRVVRHQCSCKREEKKWMLMPTINVVLTKRHANMIDALIESGRYQNASEVLREGLRLVEQREAEAARKLEALREAVRVGAEALDRGEFKHFESIEDLQVYLDDLAEKVISESAKKVISKAEK
jgi:antitoxin ParD1/3/4